MGTAGVYTVRYMSCGEQCVYKGLRVDKGNAITIAPLEIIIDLLCYDNPSTSLGSKLYFMEVVGVAFRAEERTARPPMSDRPSEW